MRKKTDVFWMKRVDVLSRIDKVEYPFLVNSLGKGELNKNAMDRFVAVELFNELAKFVACRFFWQTIHETPNADLRARVFFVAHINLTRRIVSDKNDGKRWLDARLFDKTSDLVFNLIADLLRRSFAVKYLSRHDSFLSL